jgi:TonB family protein
VRILEDLVTVSPESPSETIPVAPTASFEWIESLSTPYKRQWISFAAGAAVQIAALALVATIGLFLTPEIRQTLNRPQYVLLELSPPPLATPMPKPPPPKPLPRLTMPKPRPDQITVPKLAEVKPELKPPVLTPKRLPDLMPPKPAPKVPTVGVLQAAVAPPGDGPKMKRPGLRTDVFNGSSAAPTVKRPVSQVQTGGFGSPEGLPGNAQGGSKGNVAKLGSFDLPNGPGYGNGSGGAQGVRGTVASAGFGNGIATAGGGGGAGGSGRGGVPVREGAFGEVRAAAPSQVQPVRAAQSSSATKPVEIVFKPSPEYTEEARRAHVQGEVLLSVVFKASGEIHVVRVVSGLGHGLDESAVRAAQQIRFKPAERGGQPVDLPATLHMVFQLAS